MSRYVHTPAPLCTFTSPFSASPADFDLIEGRNDLARDVSRDPSAIFVVMNHGSLSRGEKVNLTFGLEKGASLRNWRISKKCLPSLLLTRHQTLRNWHPIWCSRREQKTHVQATVRRLRSPLCRQQIKRSQLTVRQRKVGCTCRPDDVRELLMAF